MDENVECASWEVKDDMPMLRGGERVILQDNCDEETSGSGILTLTNSRMTFETRRGLISKKTETEFSVGLDKIHNVWTEGVVRKRLAVEISWSRGPGMPESIQKRKFNVSRPSQWETTMKSIVQQE
jgi:hypothetical protein